ncbi:MAG TPA: DNA gyrase subunit A [Lentisphaeria bacterium]|nr:MAG: DNA gyrase subunit A [Lentisphaerae bacterium GWF2_50_93]HCE46415.1 DNA gyrase subunit A [Lentisphaeria bacterium]
MSDITTRDYPINIEDIMHTAYLQYSLSVNVGRAIPDVRDGLKPANRRILYAMHKLGLTKGHAYTKCAKVVGEVIGNYHPHGDVSVYETLVRMAQDFSMRETLIDGQGNFGSIDGDPPAAYRYTECRLERLAEELLVDIEKNTVNMSPTFDESTMEPDVLPSSFPNLLVNGSTGIGVGMATNMPPHNLGEIIDATVHLLDNPSCRVADLLQHVKGPDFPTGATICGVAEIKRYYETGRGSIKIRAKAEIIDKDGKEQIVVTEIPYAVNKENLVLKIAELVNDKKITGISGLRDETSRRSGIRIVVDIKRGAMATIVMNQLYAHTQLETTFGSISLVVDNKRPRILDLRQLLQAYIDHRLDVVTRRTKFELDKAEARAHILEGLLIAVKNIDEVVKIIRASRTKEIAGQTLIKRFNLSQKQTDAILEMRLHQLTGLAIEDLELEYNELLKLIAYLKSLLASREMRLKVIKDELLKIREKYASPRKTDIAPDERDLNIEDLIARHSCVITVSNTGYIKRVPATTFDSQHRGGKGVKGMETREEDFVEHLFNAHSHDIIFFFTDKGQMHWLNVYEIPEGTRLGKGKAIVNMIRIEPGELIRAMLTVPKEDVERDDLYIIMATKCGLVKKTRLSEYKNLRKAGIRAISLQDGDDLISAIVTDGKKEIILSTSLGMACRFTEDQIRIVGRMAKGVTGMRFKLKKDFVIGMEAVEPLEEIENDEEALAKGGPEILVVSDGGLGKRSLVSQYRKTRRGAKGVLNIKLREKEKVVAAVRVKQNDELLIVTVKGQTTRIPSNEIRTVGRASKGVRIMDLAENDLISGVVKLMELKEGDNPDGAIPAEPEVQPGETAAGEPAPEKE